MYDDDEFVLLQFYGVTSQNPNIKSSETIAVFVLPYGLAFFESAQWIR